MINTQGHTMVLAGHGCDEAGPYLAFNNLTLKQRLCYEVRGKTFSLTRQEQRRCVGRFDLDTSKREPCPLGLVLSAQAKDDMCPACQEATGFNPSFYHSDYTSAKQRRYNAKPHTTYLAYFSPRYVKAGITSAEKGRRRLLEQGARAGCVVGSFDDAYQARGLEAILCAQPGVVETMRAAKKAELLAHERYDPKEALEVLQAYLVRLGGLEEVNGAGFSPQTIQDYSAHYFGAPSPSSDCLQLVDEGTTVCGGRCIGMVGDALLFDQGDAIFVVSLKNWFSHEVEFIEGKVLCTFNFSPKQMSLL